MNCTFCRSCVPRQFRPQSQRGPVGRERRAGGRAIVSVFTVKVAGVGGSQAVPASDFEGIEVNFCNASFLPGAGWV